MDLHRDESYFAVGEIRRKRASEPCNLISYLNVGGAISLIFNNNLDGEGWRKKLNDAAEQILNEDPLKNLAESLANTPI